MRHSLPSLWRMARTEELMAYGVWQEVGLSGHPSSPRPSSGSTELAEVWVERFAIGSSPPSIGHSLSALLLRQLGELLTLQCFLQRRIHQHLGEVVSRLFHIG